MVATPCVLRPTDANRLTRESSVCLRASLLMCYKCLCTRSSILLNRHNRLVYEEDQLVPKLPSSKGWGGEKARERGCWAHLCGLTDSLDNTVRTSLHSTIRPQHRCDELFSGVVAAAVATRGQTFLAAQFLLVYSPRLHQAGDDVTPAVAGGHLDNCATKQYNNIMSAAVNKLTRNRWAADL